MGSHFSAVRTVTQSPQDLAAMERRACLLVLQDLSVQNFPAVIGPHPVGFADFPVACNLASLPAIRTVCSS